MASSTTTTRLHKSPRKLRDLWQLPLFILSLGLFGYAAYLFIDPKPGLTVDDRIAAARLLLNQERPDAAIDSLNKLLASSKLDKPHEGKVHLMLAEGISAAESQKDKTIRVPRKNEQIIEQIGLALANEIKPTYDVHRRLAEAYEALHNPRMALRHYQSAIALDPDHSLRMQRKIIDLELSVDDTEGAAASLDEYLQRNELSDSERAWALGESAHLRIDKSRYTDARQALAEAAKLNIDPVDQGQINYWLGYCAYRLKDYDEAEKILRVSRDQMRDRHPLDGDAAFLLGQMAQERKDWKLANSFYEVVLVNHPEARVAPLAKLGRGVCRIATGEDDAGLTDLHDLVNQLNQKGDGPMKFREETLAGLRQASEMLTTRANYTGAMELLAYEQDIEPKLPAGFFARLGTVYERRADQLDKIAQAAKAADQVKGQQEARDLRAKAGDAYVGYSRALTLADDKGYGEALWHGIDLYDRSGDLRRTISALKVFVAERPEDLLAADALLRLGRAYQAMGMYDEAIAAFQQNIFRHGSSLAANKSAIPLAQAYVAKGPEFYGRAESTLRGLLENALVTPEAAEFRQALFDLAQLYYRTNRYEEALAKLQELNDRYPKDQHVGQVLFLMADSYRKSAHLLKETYSTTQPTQGQPQVDPAEVSAARKGRLVKAKQHYDRVIETYEKDAPANDAEKTYLRLSHFYRADCAYDLGNYIEAIRLYDAAAFRYQDDPSALSAYVQIVNSYCALGKFDDAKTANERAKVLLKRIPQDAFADGSFSMPKEYWQEWLKWTGESGLWK